MAKFFSKCSNQVITISPDEKIFHNGYGQNVKGERIVFENSNYETNDERIIEFIRSHSLFGRAVVEVDDIKALKEAKKAAKEEKTEE